MGSELYCTAAAALMKEQERWGWGPEGKTRKQNPEAWVRGRQNHWPARGRPHQVLHAHGLQRVIALGCLSGQHDAVGPIQDSIGHVAALSPCGPGLLDHALQHLQGTGQW